MRAEWQEHLRRQDARWQSLNARVTELATTLAASLAQRCRMRSWTWCWRMSVAQTLSSKMPRLGLFP